MTLTNIETQLKIDFKMINSTAGYFPSHLYLRHTLIFLEISIFLKKRLWLKLETYSVYSALPPVNKLQEVHYFHA